MTEQMPKTNNYFSSNPLYIYYKTLNGSKYPTRTDPAKVVIIFKGQLYTADNEPIAKYYKYLSSVYQRYEHQNNAKLLLQLHHRLEIEGGWYYIRVITFRSLDKIMTKYLPKKSIAPKYRFVYDEIMKIRERVSLINHINYEKRPKRQRGVKSNV